MNIRNQDMLGQTKKQNKPKNRMTRTYCWTSPKREVNSTKTRSLWQTANCKLRENNTHGPTDLYFARPHQSAKLVKWGLHTANCTKTTQTYHCWTSPKREADQWAKFGLHKQRVSVELQAQAAFRFPSTWTWIVISRSLRRIIRIQYIHSRSARHGAHRRCQNVTPESIKKTKVFAPDLVP